jgi:hypothetical protein
VRACDVQAAEPAMAGRAANGRRDADSRVRLELEADEIATIDRKVGRERVDAVVGYELVARVGHGKDLALALAQDRQRELAVRRADRPAPDDAVRRNDEGRARKRSLPDHAARRRRPDGIAAAIAIRARALEIAAEAVCAGEQARRGGRRRGLRAPVGDAGGQRRSGDHARCDEQGGASPVPRPRRGRRGRCLDRHARDPERRRAGRSQGRQRRAREHLADGTHDRLGGRRPLVRRLRERAREHLVERLGKLVAASRDARRRLARVSEQHGGVARAREHDAAAETLEQHRGERVAVRSRGCGLAADHFRSQVRERPDELSRRRHGCARAELREPEIGEIAVVGRADEDVSRLDVAMDEPSGVDGVERTGDLREQVHRPLAAERAVDQQRRQRRPAHQPHRQEESALGLPGLVHGDHVRMRERRVQAALAAEAADELGVGAELGTEHLQRDRPAERLVRGLVDRRHAPSAEHRDHAVPADGGAGGEHVTPGRRGPSRGRPRAHAGRARRACGSGAALRRRACRRGLGRAS